MSKKALKNNAKTLSKNDKHNLLSLSRLPREKALHLSESILANSNIVLQDIILYIKRAKQFLRPTKDKHKIACKSHINQANTLKQLFTLVATRKICHKQKINQKYHY